MTGDTTFVENSRVVDVIQGISRVIMSPAEYKMQPTIHPEEKPDFYRFHVQVYNVPMYCGLHFLFRRAHYHS
jgi:hypothetical protein